MKRYELLKDTILFNGVYKAGKIIEESGDGYAFAGTTSQSLYFNKTTVENNPEWFREVKWKPTLGEHYKFISTGYASGSVSVALSTWMNDNLDKDRYASGNCFPVGSSECKEKADQIRKILKGE